MRFNDRGFDYLNLLRVPNYTKESLFKSMNAFCVTGCPNISTTIYTIMEKVTYQKTM